MAKSTTLGELERFINGLIVALVRLGYTEKTALGLIATYCEIRHNSIAK